MTSMKGRASRQNVEGLGAPQDCISAARTKAGATSEAARTAETSAAETALMSRGCYCVAQS